MSGSIERAAEEREAASQAATSRSTVERPTMGRPTMGRPMVNRPTVHGVVRSAAVERSAASQAATSRSTVERSTIEPPTMERPMVKRPTVHGAQRSAIEPWIERSAIERAATRAARQCTSAPQAVDHTLVSWYCRRRVKRGAGVLVAIMGLRQDRPQQRSHSNKAGRARYKEGDLAHKCFHGWRRSR